MKAHVNGDGEPIPDVSRREMKTFQAMADEYVDAMGSGVLDLSTAEHKDRFREWLTLVIRGVAFEMEWAYRRAVDSALTQADGLMRDPHRYKNQARRMKERKAKLAEQRPSSEERIRQHEKQMAERLWASLENEDGGES